MPRAHGDTLISVETNEAAGGIARLLSQDNELIRSAALRAYTVLASDADVREALRTALTDQDPDIRSDAMERLVTLARPEDVSTLMASLEGDPVREVKLAAIQALSNIDGRDSIALLRKLVLSKSENSIAWEDEGSDWDDWLDVQIAAIAALGQMGATEAIEDILAARADEFAQDLDVVAFEAFCKMGPNGIGALLGILRDERDSDFRRAATAIASASVEALSPHIDALLRSKDPDVRIIALNALPPDDSRVEQLALSDPSSDVRKRALRHAGKINAKLIEEVLSDPDENVQAEALLLLDGKISSHLHEALVENMLLWLRHAGANLATAAASALPCFAPDRSKAPLLELIADTERPLEARVEAVKALAEITPPISSDSYADILTNPAQQVRVAALKQLSRYAETDDRLATNTIAAAISGTLVQTSAAAQRNSEDDQYDVAMPKGEDGPLRIRITREGDIVEGENADRESTLQKIISAGESAVEEAPNAEAEDTPEERPAKRLKRKPVEGPMDVAPSLQLDSIRICGTVVNGKIKEAILNKACDGKDEIRQSVWSAIAKWPREENYSDEVLVAAKSAMTDTIPIVRQAAFGVLAKTDIPAECLKQALGDEDALVRTEAVARLSAKAALDFMADSAPPVRRAAIARIVADKNLELAKTAAGLLLKAEHVDTLGDLFKVSKDARLTSIANISKLESGKQLLVLLEALAKSA